MQDTPARLDVVVNRALHDLKEEELPLAQLDTLPRIAQRTRERFVTAQYGNDKGDESSLENLRLSDQLKHWKGHLFLLHDSKDTDAPGDPNRILIFATKKNVEWMAKAEVWIGDGTWKRAPDLAQQMYTISALLNGFAVPLMFVSLPSQSQAFYKKMFHAIRHYILQTNGDAYITLLLDYEKAAWMAAEERAYCLNQLGVVTSTLPMRSGATSRSMGWRQSMSNISVSV